MRIDHDTLMKITLELVDDRIREDAARLKRVRCMSRDELCATYTAGR